MDEKMAEQKALQASCLSFIETLFPEETFEFVDRVVLPDAFGKHGTHMTFQSAVRELKLSFVDQAHSRFERVFLAEKTAESPFFSRIMEATYEEGQLYIHHVLKSD
ncbi:hypothetical protein [Exiguobacterium sp. 17-1]|uniref:hypothetical protein n=1 Tax=Exiguobacterium sp. 17-1 TaxID=2931981 RepID=UPI001FFF1CCE|nr:hypothetical protein [Exiguobacterium sp. 17-1]MCK2156211.1 hypothetical protein [Exiguobacterium sp. 17-1]